MEAIKRDYEPPALVTLGSVESLTKLTYKAQGQSDGFVLIPDTPLVDASIVKPN